MRKLIGLTLSFSLTCTIGVFVSECRDKYFPRQVSLCMLARNPGGYHQKVVQVSATGVVISRSSEWNQLIVFEAGCAEPDAGASIRFDDSYQPSDEIVAFITSPTREIRKGKFVVTGQFDMAATKGCYAPKFAIVATRIALESVLPSEPLPKLTNRVHDAEATGVTPPRTPAPPVAAPSARQSQPSTEMTPGAFRAMAVRDSLRARV